MPTQAEIDAAKAAKEKEEKKKSTTKESDVYYENKVPYSDIGPSTHVDKLGGPGFDADLPEVKRTYADPNKHADLPGVDSSGKETYTEKLARLHEESESGSEPETELSTTFGDVTNETSTPSLTSTSKNKSSGTLSYKDSYTDAVASKWESKGGYDAYEKAAKAWNTKKYGTTNPTADAKTAGITTDKLASKHKVDSTKFTESLTIDGKKTDVKDLGPEYTSYGVMAPKPSATSKYTSVNKPHRPNTSNNTSLANTIAATNSSESLLGGVQTRREKRQRSREQRKNLRQTGNKFVSSADAQAASDRTKAMITPEKKKNWKSSLSNKTFGM